MKHLPFDSIYRENFEVVEERQGPVRLFPHTAQLPIIHRALNLEFLGPLPGKLSRLDHRAKDLDLIARRIAGLLFSGLINGTREDELRLFPLLDRNRITQMAVVQHVRKETRLGLCHRFRFYAGPDFFPEIFLNGKRVVFSDHAVQRFASRVPHLVGSDYTDLIFSFFGTPMISLPLGPGRAFFAQMTPSFAAFPYKESAQEFFITTCLTLDQIHSFELELPPPAYNFHYAPAFTRPEVRHWVPTLTMHKFHKAWETKIPLPLPHGPGKERTWSKIAQWIPDALRLQGHGTGSKFRFLDNLCGPAETTILPGQPEPAFNELESYKLMSPDQDWDAIFAENFEPPEHLDRIKS